MGNLQGNLGEQPVTPEAVRWAYRLVLGREPENQAVVDDCVAHVADLGRLRERFISSSEFLESQHAGTYTKTGGMEPPCRVDIDVDDATRARLLDHVAKSWTQLGETEPYWSVMSDPAYLMEHIGESREAFLATGRENIGRLFAALRRNGIEPNPEWDVFELGCGLGRVTRWLAPEFRSVTACDISAPHLRLAQAINADAAEIGRVQWELLRHPSELQHLARCDLFFSVIVLQHNPPPVIALLLENIAASLRPGGVAFFQVPTYIRDYHFDVNEYLRVREGNRDIEMHALPQARILATFAKHGCVPIEIFEDELSGTSVTQRSNAFVFRKLADDDSAVVDLAALRMSNAALRAEITEMHTTVAGMLAQLAGVRAQLAETHAQLVEIRAAADHDRVTAREAARHAQSLEVDRLRLQQEIETANARLAGIRHRFRAVPFLLPKEAPPHGQ